jgi:hypothetical protein
MHGDVAAAWRALAGVDVVCHQAAPVGLGARLVREGSLRETARTSAVLT